MRLSDQNIKQIRRELSAQGVFNRELLEDLTDHLACKVEDKVREGRSYELALAQSNSELFPNGAYAIQREFFMENLKNYIQMRKAQFLIGYLAVAITLIGYTFKIMHWPTANIQLIMGSAIFGWVFIPAYWTNRFVLDKQKRRENSRWYYIFNATIAMIAATSMPLTFMHGPYHKAMMIVSLLILTFYFMPKIFISMYKHNVLEAQVAG